MSASYVPNTNDGTLRSWLQSTTQPCSSDILVLDGGVSTHLEQTLQAKDPSRPAFPHRELWSSSLLLSSGGREAIRQCHEEFYRAGADIASTVTYQAHYMPLPGGKGRSSSDLQLAQPVVDQMLRDGVRLAREAGDRCGSTSNEEGRRFYVAASIGSLGGALADGSEYTGKFGLTLEQLTGFHRQKTQVLAAESPDVLAFETIPCILECVAVLTVLRELKLPGDGGRVIPPPPAWLSLACRDGLHLNDGSTLIEAVTKINELDPRAELIHALGVNCCACENVMPLLRKLVQHMLRFGPRRAVVFYPNSGEEWDATNEAWREGTGVTTPDDFSDVILANLRAVRDECRLGRQGIPIIVGGCCRTTPDTIAAIRSKVDRIRRGPGTQP